MKTMLPDKPGFRACAGSAQGFGGTPTEALNALLTHLTQDTTMPTPIVIWPYNRGDAFFSDAQQERLRDLKTRQQNLVPYEQKELEKLVEAAFDASIARTDSRQNVSSESALSVRL